MTHRNKNFIVTVGLSCAFLMLVTTARAQTPAATPQADATPQAFEVASIRAVSPDHETTTFPSFPSAQFVVENMSLKLLIAIAYGMSDNRITGQDSLINSTFFTVKAKPEGDAALTAKQYQPLLQQLLQQRFKLTVHHETKDVPGYALVVAKGGPKLTPAKDDTDAIGYILPEGLRSASISTKTIAALLSRPLGQPVIDKTGITGHYDLDLKFAPATSTESTLPSIFTAVQEQLGLKLESQKVPTDFLVVDHVEKVPTEN